MQRDTVQSIVITKWGFSGTSNMRLEDNGDCWLDELAFRYKVLTPDEIVLLYNTYREYLFNNYDVFILFSEKHFTVTFL